jgi:hypothetical protein
MLGSLRLVHPETAASYVRNVSFGEVLVPWPIAAGTLS